MRAIDLCAGCGGKSLGFKVAGFDVEGVELDPDAAATYRENVGPCDHADLREWHPLGCADVVTAGIPCQPFSYAGNREGEADPRGQLFAHVLRVARECGARALVLENVRGLATADGGAVLRGYLDALRGEAWAVFVATLRASHYGVPQDRDRVFVAAFRDPLAEGRFRWPEATHGELGKPAPVTLREALGLRGQYATAARLARATTEAGGKPRGWWQGGRALDVERPGYTVGTRDNYDLLVPADDLARDEVAAMARSRTRAGTGDGYRLNVPELSRVQGFPAGFAFAGGHSSRHRQCGNAVPPGLAEAVARAVHAALEGE